MVEGLISIEEAARRLGGISKWTVHSWLSKGKLRRVKVGSRTMLDPKDLDAVVEVGGKNRTRDTKPAM